MAGPSAVQAEPLFTLLGREMAPTQLRQLSGVVVVCAQALGLGLVGWWEECDGDECAIIRTLQLGNLITKKLQTVHVSFQGQSQTVLII